MESGIQEPYYCSSCSIYGARQLLVFDGRTRVCLGCVADFKHILDRYKSVSRVNGSGGSEGGVEANSHNRDTQSVPAAGEALEAHRRDILHACLDAADTSGAQHFWVTADTLIDEARKQLSPMEVSRRSILRELVLHTLAHPERHRFPIDRVG